MLKEKFLIILIYITSSNLFFARQYATTSTHIKKDNGIKSTCRLAQLPEGVRIHGACSFRREATCHATCRFGATTLWRRDIQCQSHGAWSTSHKCSPRGHSAHFEVIPCSRLVEALPSEKHCVRIWQPGPPPPKQAVCPELLRIYVQLGKCRRVGKGECAVSCLEDGFSLMCMADGVWYPHCRVDATHATLCPASLHPATLVDCARTPGAECKVRCPNGKVAEKTVLCSPAGQWTRLPKCQYRGKCASQHLTSKIRFLDPDCKASDRLFCVVECSKGVSKQKQLKCSKRGVWTGLPTCPQGCPKQELDKNAVIISCPATTNSECRYKCKKGFTVDGTRQCNGEGFWLGRVRCKKSRRCPKLGSKFRVEGSCSGIAQSTCRLRCEGQEGRWIDVRCDKAGVWSGLPVCNAPSCPEPQDKIGIRLVDTCVRKKPGQKCQVECKKGFSFKEGSSEDITCGTNLTWTRFPVCEKECIKPKLSENSLKSVDSCTNKLPMDTCSVSCSEGGKLIGDNTIKCLENSVWSVLPDCFCPEPTLTDDLKEVANCDTKRRNEKCELRCTDSKLKITGTTYITCQNNTKWSQLPTCSNKFCPAPNIPLGVLKSTNDCSKKAVQQMCPLECVGGGNLTGGNHIKCLTNQTWSPLPDCTCPEPNLHENLEFKEMCVNVTRNKTCEVYCITGYKISNIKLITCQFNLSWSNQPTCSKVCLQPNLSENNLKSADGCTNKLPMDTCRLNCSEGGKMIGNNTIKCLENREWSTLPECLCPKPTLNEDLEFHSKEYEDCSNKKRNETCFLKCKNSSMGIKQDNDIISCQQNTKWNSLPKCISFCPKPDFDKDVHVLGPKCTKRLPGDTCFALCSNGGRMTGNGSIKCLNGRKWSDFPKCACPVPFLYGTNLEEDENCTHKLPNERCLLKCTTGYKIGTPNYIECLNSTKWSSLPVCNIECPQPSFISLVNAGDSRLEFVNSCVNKIAGEQCLLRCVDNNFTMALTCFDNGTWSARPPCVKHCLDINGKYGAVTVQSGCTGKSVGDRCPIRCTHGGFTSHENEFALCQEDLTWKFPECYCDRPYLPIEFETREGDCRGTRRNETCKIGCVDPKKYMAQGQDHILCDDEAKWSSPASSCYDHRPCPPIIWDLVLGGLFVADGMLTQVNDCSAKFPGEWCEVKCTHGGPMIGVPKIECLENANWDAAPSCNCPEPNVWAKDSQLGSCANVRPNENCKVYCTTRTSMLEGPDIHCNAYAKWERLPICTTCPVPVERPNEYQHNDCLFIRDDPNLRYQNLCKVTCGMGIVMSECLESTLTPPVWNPPLECSACPTLDWTGTTMVQETSCENIPPGGSCMINCKYGGIFMYRNPVNGTFSNKYEYKCHANSTWESPPACTCGHPPPIEGGALYSNKDGGLCLNAIIGSRCYVRCLFGFTLIGSEAITCAENTRWNDLPKCLRQQPAPQYAQKQPAPQYAQQQPAPQYAQQQPAPQYAQQQPESCTGPYCNDNCGFPNVDHVSYINGRLCNAVTHTKTCKIETCTEGFVAIPNSEIRCVVPSRAEAHWEPVSGDMNKCVLQHAQQQPAPQYAQQQPDPQYAQQQPAPPYAQFSRDIRCGSRAPCMVCPPIQYSPGFEHWFAEVLVPIDDDCSHATPGTQCTVACLNGGNVRGEGTTFMSGNTLVGKMTCQENGEWEDPFFCRCQVPMHDGLTDASRADCADTDPERDCEINCGEGYDRRLDAIYCRREGVWMKGQEPCVRPKCGSPPIQNADPASLRACSRVSPGGTCTVACLPGFVVVGGSDILCGRDLEWMRLMPMTGERWFAGKVKCESLDTRSSSRLEPLQFDTRSRSEKTTCSFPNHPFLDTVGGDCSRMSPFQLCRFACRYGGAVIGDPLVMCDVTGEWVDFPDCTCPVVDFIPYARIEDLEQCSRVQRGRNCEVRCVSGYVWCGGSSGLYCNALAQWEIPRNPCIKREKYDALSQTQLEARRLVA